MSRKEYLYRYRYIDISNNQTINIEEININDGFTLKSNQFILNSCNELFNLLNNISIICRDNLFLQGLYILRIAIN